MTKKECLPVTSVVHAYITDPLSVSSIALLFAAICCEDVRACEDYLPFSATSLYLQR